MGLAVDLGANADADEVGVPNLAGATSAAGREVVVYVVTYRRHDMLRRALRSVLAQTHADFCVKVVNDDPDDHEVERIVGEMGDPRVGLFSPVLKRGGTLNFSLAFEETQGEFVSILEDDNWWEPTFLEDMIRVLDAHPNHEIVIGNELLWRETPGGEWINTGQRNWPFEDARERTYAVEEICGSARLCNSAMLVRTQRTNSFAIPGSTPLDVTEHFRERLLPATVLLNGAPLVNYAVTLQTNRVETGELWGVYQQLLIGSVFVAAPTREARTALARRLWSQIEDPTSPRAVSFVATGVAIKGARALLATAPALALARFAAWLIRKPWRVFALATATRHADELSFLADAPLTRDLANAP